MAQEGMHTPAPSANNLEGVGGKKPRGAFSRRPSASTTPPRTPSTQFIFLPIKGSPPAWLWEAQFMLRALGILFLAGTERGSQRGGGRTSRSLVSCRQRRAGTGSPRADRKSAAPTPRLPHATAGLARAGPTAMGGLRDCSSGGAERGKGLELGLGWRLQGWRLSGQHVAPLE